MQKSFRVKAPGSASSICKTYPHFLDGANASFSSGRIDQIFPNFGRVGFIPKERR